MVGVVKMGLGVQPKSLLAWDQTLSVSYCCNHRATEWLGAKVVAAGAFWDLCWDFSRGCTPLPPMYIHINYMYEIDYELDREFYLVDGHYYILFLFLHLTPLLFV